LQVLVSYLGKSVPVMMYNVFNSSNSNFIGKYARLDFYGSYFRLLELDFFNLSLSDWLVFLTSEDPYISRIDYCVDLFYKYLHPFPKVSALLD
jgi:hypothetical protein